MRRGLPYSLVLHVVVLVVTVVYGAHVTSPPLQPRRLIKVRLVELPQPEVAPPPERPIETEPVIEPVPEPPPPEPEPEPRHVPEPEPKDVEVEPEAEAEPPPEPEQKVQESEPADQKTVVTDTIGEEPTISSTDEPFPFGWYLRIVKQQITRHWNPPLVGMRDVTERTCAVHFVIERGGGVTRATIVSSSGITLLDRAGLRAVQAAHPLPPLPREFGSRSLGITFVFHSKSSLQ